MQETGLDEAAEIASPEKLISEKLEIKDDSQRLISQLKNLKEEYRDVLVMKYLDEMSIGEIAESLEKTSNNVRVLLHRAKNALKEITSDEYNK